VDKLEVVYLRLPAELKAALQRWADAEWLPLNAHLARVLRDAVLDYEEVQDRQRGPHDPRPERLAHERDPRHQLSP